MKLNVNWKMVASVLSLALSVLAEPPTPSNPMIYGRVLDPARTAVSGAVVIATPESKSATVSGITSGAGEFALPVALGSYSIRVSADGFEESSKKVAVGPSGVDALEFVLEIASVRQTVTVTEGPSYETPAISSATKTLTELRDVPQAIAVVTQSVIRDQMMMSIGDVVRYVPGITAHQGENNRDQVIIRGNNSSADFFVNGVRDDVQYFRDLYNLERVEALKGPNALMFGRGGGGGVINRVTKEAGFTPLREISLLGGSFNNARVAADFDQPLGDKAAFRLNGTYQNSDSFRNYIELQRYGISPTVTLMPGTQTKVTLSYEHFRDTRTADRGIPSFQGHPVDVPVSTFFGNPEDSHVRARVNLGVAAIEHQAGRLNIRNRTHFGDYDRGYQNYVPGAVNASGSEVSISAYNNTTGRLNAFNQTDFSLTGGTGPLRHTLLWGAEGGRQSTDNFRNTGYFNNAVTTTLVALSNPVVDTPVTFRQSATDANNHIETMIGATYLQDQVEVSRYVRLIAGVRFDHFDLQYRNNRTSGLLRRIDNLVSPRAGVVIKPVGAVSVYGSYSVSYLPSSGDQFSSLTTITQQVKPEKFSNYEVGVKWDVRRALSITAAGYRLDRTNTRSTDPNDPTRIVQTGSQRSTGFEFGLNGSITNHWQIAGGYAYQEASVTRATTAARAGARVAQVPRNSFSLWNNYRVLQRLGVGLGLLNRADMFAAIDNTVVLPGYTRADAAVFYSITERVRLQANVENLFDKMYYLNADSNTNLSPGSPRAVRVGLIARF